MQPPRPPRVIYCLAVWVAISLFFVGQGAVGRLIAHQPFVLTQNAAVTVISCVLWGLFTAIIWRLSQRFPFEGHRTRDTFVHTALALSILLLDCAIDVYALEPFFGLTPPPFWTVLIRTSYIDLSSYFCICILENMQRSQWKSAQETARAGKLESDLRQARLRALEAQLRPHFLFNALNTISSLVRGGQSDAAVRAVAALGDVLRGSLRQTAPEVVLRDELMLAERYLDLERARFGEAVSFTVDADDDACDAMVPSLVLQPLVENALKHGRGQDGRARIAIRACRNGALLRLEVQDGGAGPVPGAAEGIGISNTRARLEQLYGGKGRLDLIAANGGGALAVVELPLREATGAGHA